ncbi:unnamed protein product, partial [Vitis vinifera]
MSFSLGAFCGDGQSTIRLASVRWLNNLKKILFQASLLWFQIENIQLGVYYSINLIKFLCCFKRAAINSKPNIKLVFGMILWNYGPDVMDALLELILSLAASSGNYLDGCLDVLVSNFMPPYSFLDLLKQSRGLARKDQVLSRVHSTSEDISDLVPLVPSRLVPKVIQRMPNVFTEEPLIVLHVENMLRLESGAIQELVGKMMLVAMMDRLVDLDVEIAWEEILQDDYSQGMFEMS